MSFLSGKQTVAAIFLLLAAAPPLRAEDSDFFARPWQTDEGLPDNNISGVVQAADGYLWVGTLGGLMRFDGVRFQEFSPSRLPGVPNRVVRSLLLDRRGRLWIGIDRGVIVCTVSNTARVYTEQ